MVLSGGCSGVNTGGRGRKVASSLFRSLLQAQSGNHARSIKMKRAKRKKRDQPWYAQHSLSLVSVGLLILWIVGYSRLDPETHLGSFCGNAIADWSGSVVIILGTKFFYEVGSAESRPFLKHRKNPVLDFFWRHSLLILIGVTGLGWLILSLRMSPDSKWGQVVGNLVSEWVQMAGLVFLTKRLIERGSKESQ